MTRLLGFATVAATASVFACGTAPNATPCSQSSDCTGDGVCVQSLCQQGYRLSMAPTGDGAGRITSAPDAFNCSAACSAPLAAGTNITLRAIPDSNSDFLGWSGGCSGTGDCPVTMDGAKSVTALFRSNRVIFTSALALDGTDAQDLNQVFNIWRVNADGTGRSPLTRATATGVGSTTPRSSPDGTLVVFASSLKLDGTDAANAASTANIWRVNADGSALRPLTSGTATRDSIVAMTPEWSRDGRQIVFTSLRNLDASDAPSNPAVSNVWRVNADGTGLAAVTKTTVPGTSNVSPRWSADGTQAVFTSTRKLDGTDAPSAPSVSNVWRANADGTGLTALTTASAANMDSNLPEISTDGRRIVFASSRNIDLTNTANANNVPNIWTINSDGTGLAPLTRATALNVTSDGPHWSPNGAQVVFVSTLALDGSNAPNVANTANVWRVNADGTGLVPLTRLTATGSADLTLLFPQWSLDGSRVIFTSALKLDGSNALNAPNSTPNVWRFSVSNGSLLPLTRGTAEGASSSSCATGGASAPSLLGLLAASWLRRRRRR
jgi:Tol biopolymer transport system component